MLCKKFPWFSHFWMMRMMKLLFGLVEKSFLKSCTVILPKAFNIASLATSTKPFLPSFIISYFLVSTYVCEIKWARKSILSCSVDKCSHVKISFVCPPMAFGLFADVPSLAKTFWISLVHLWECLSCLQSI